MNQSVQSHGSIPYAEARALGIDPSSILDFSATVNPFPLPPSVQAMFSPEGIAAYPDTDSFEARQAIAAYHNIPAAWTLLCAGLTELIYLMPLVYTRAVYFAPSYGDYAAAFARHWRPITAVSFPKSNEDFGGTVDSLCAIPFELLMVCNPNNPTGDYLPPDRIGELCKRFGQAIICIDESYQEMGENCDSALHLIGRFHNLLILKSLTKPFGVGGLRAGYAVSSPVVVERLRRYLTPWGVSSIAQRIVPPLMAYVPFFKRQWADILIQKQDMMRAISRQGFTVASKKCPFFLVKTGAAEGIRQRLLTEHHIAVRSCASFGMPEWIRIMPGRPEHNGVLLEALRTVCR